MMHGTTNIKKNVYFDFFHVPKLVNSSFTLLSSWPSLLFWYTLDFTYVANSLVLIFPFMKCFSLYYPLFTTSISRHVLSHYVRPAWCLVLRRFPSDGFLLLETTSNLRNRPDNDNFGQKSRQCKWDLHLSFSRAYSM